MISPFQNYPLADYTEMMTFIVRTETKQAEALGAWCIENLDLTNGVIDVGCGPGIYLDPFHRKGITVMGIDAMPHKDMPDFVRVDLRLPYHPLADYRYSLAICFEVAEHLEAEYADTLVDTLCRCSDTILFSAATVGQGGTFHLNEQPVEYWLKKFIKRGYGMHSENPDLQDFFHTLEWGRANGEISPWLIDHTYLLSKQ